MYWRFLDIFLSIILVLGFLISFLSFLFLSKEGILFGMFMYAMSNLSDKIAKRLR